MPDHAFVRSSNPNFGSAFGGGCDAQVDGKTCGWPESAHPAPSDQVTLTFKVTRKAFDALARGAEHEGITKTEALGRAVNLYSGLVDATPGETFVYRGADGTALYRLSVHPLCPTCQGRNCETVGMVCRTCGRDCGAKG